MKILRENTWKICKVINFVKGKKNSFLDFKDLWN